MVNLNRLQFQELEYNLLRCDKPRKMAYSQIKNIFRALLSSHVRDCDECYCHQLIS